MLKRHRIQFPKSESSNLKQDESYFFLQGSGKQRKIRFHDYDEIYQVPGLYEQIFYDRLKCTSPVKVTSILEAAIRQSNDNFTELRVLDLGAGNGMMGEELKKHGVSRLIGVDIIPEAYEATIRDRPG
ncbi:MAG: methyltransferase, partial [Gammaproteobacteria bacterium]|nr:methyltransferase [Gammaproteobacteria bacterium]